MNIQYKNFIHLLRRYPLPMLGNILGLAVALAVFLIISMEVTYNRNYDRQIKDVDRLFLFTVKLDSVNYNVHMCRPMCEKLATASPHIEQVAFRNLYDISKRIWMLNDTEIELAATSVAANYFDTFGFSWVACDTTTFTDPHALFLPESLARRIYQTVDLIRKPANPTQDTGTYIGGIYRDFPENSSLLNILYWSIGDENKDNYSNYNYRCFLKLTAPEQKNAVEEAIKSAFLTDADQRMQIQLIPYTELHFRKELQQDRNLTTVDPDSQYLFLFIALVILVVACINFTNLYAALCPLRIRSINTRKVLGATRGELFRSLTAETTLVSLGAWLLALLLVYAADRAGLSELQHATISLSAHPLLTASSLGLALLMGFVSGVYPALYATSFQPALVLKGNFGLSPKGRSLRNLLIGIQFTTSFALAISVFNVWQQNDYMRHSELGYDQHRLINIPTRDFFGRDGGVDAFVDGLKQLAVVEDAALFFNRLSSLETGQMSWGRALDNVPSEENHIQFKCMPASPNILRTAGIPITEGRDFAPTDVGSYIFNETARRMFKHLKVGSTINEESVIGFCADFKFADVHQEVEPMAFKLMNSPEYENWAWQHYILVRIKKNIPLEQALTAIRDYARPLVPDRDIEVLSQLDVMDITYAEDAKQLKSLILFCALAIFISLTSVFGLVVFECEYRRKEIGIRKVMGATTDSILRMLCRKYIWIMTISFAVAAPPAWYAIDLWLQEFAYRTEILPWTFLAPLVIITLVVLLTVSIQSYRTARANPIDSLRTE